MLTFSLFLLSPYSRAKLSTNLDAKLVSKYLLVPLLALFLSACAHPVKKKLAQLGTIPSSCMDQKGKYSPITSILSKGQYNANPHTYKPINNEKGYIAYDFNADNKSDFFFIERMGKDIRLISCLSGPKRSVRRVTPFKVHETIEPDFQTISESIHLENGNLVLLVSRHEHNWGTDADISHYTFDKKLNDFKLTQREINSSSGDGLRSDTTEFYNLKARRYSRSNSCGGLEEGCKSSKSKGRLILPNPQPTLFKPTKAYARLVPDR